MRFLATADWQLGMTAHFLSDESRPRFHQARIDAVRRIGEVAAKENVDFVLVCGDVFESNQLDRAILPRTFDAVRSFTVPVLLLPGNHDPLDASSIYNSPAFAENAPDKVHVLRDSTPYTVAAGVEVVGAPLLVKKPDTDLVARAYESLEPASPGVVRIIAGHGSVSTLNPDRDSVSQIDVPGLLSALSAGKAHFAVIGDRHSTYEVDPRIWYPGAPEVTDRKEDDPGNVLVVEISEDGATSSVRKIHVGTWAFTTIQERINSLQDVEALHTRLQSMPDKERSVLWLALTGTVSTAVKARLDDVLAEAELLFARLDHWERHSNLVVLPDDHDFDDMGLSGFAEAAVSELVEVAKGDGKSAQTAQDALGLLYRYARAEQ